MANSDITGNGDTFDWVTSSYKRELVDEFKAAVPPSARMWVPGYSNTYTRKKSGHWEIASSYFQTVIDLSEKHRFNVDVFGSVTQPQSRQHRIKLEYMGMVRHRGGDMYTSSGWVDGGWNVSFTLDVLQDWFRFKINPGQMPTLFSVVGVDENLSGLEFDKALKSAYRRAARTWHPDVNQEQDAHITFQKINDAYEKLQDPMFRKRYAAGLRFQKDIESNSAVYGSTAINWRPPLRCGNLTIQATMTMEKYTVEKILDWQDIKDSNGKVLVTYWKPGADFFSKRWVI